MKTELSIKKGVNWPLWGVLLIAFLFRFLFLALKPPHFDEGINGWFVDQLITKGYYPYDPTNYHGPLHFYILFLFKILMGRNLWALRLPSSIAAVLGIYLIAKLEIYLGKFTAYTAALFAAVSPGMVFYSRYAIHESDLFVFSLLALHGFLRYRTRKDVVSLWQLGLGIVGMAITKETFIIHGICFVTACFCLRLYEQITRNYGYEVSENFLDENIHKNIRPQYTEKDLSIVYGVSLLIFVLFYSGFFLHWEGVMDFFRSFMAWFQTGQKGNGHEKVFYYWFQLFGRYEYVAILGLAYCVAFIWPFKMKGLIRLLGIYGVGVLLAYSIVPYKTPWCVLNILWPFFIMAASLLEQISIYGGRRGWAFFKSNSGLSEANFKPSAALLCVVGVLSLAGAAKSYDLNFFQYTNEQEPYVYVQTFSDIMDINKKVQKLVKGDPSKYHMPIKLFMDSHWPIPWLWGDFTHVAYYGLQGAVDPDADLILVDVRAKALIESHLKKSYYVQPFRLRSAQDPGFVYYDMDTFKDFFDAKSPVFKPVPQEPLKPGQGLLAEYFQNADWMGLPAMTKVAPKPDFYMEDAQRPLPAPWGIVYSGEILIPDSGPRSFILSSDDGSDLSIDNKMIISNLGAHPEQAKSGSGQFKKGWHKIKLRYNDYGGGMVLRLSWINASGFQEEIEPRFFRIHEIKNTRGTP